MADGIEKLPRGIRNKNPGNIKLGTDWDGLAAVQTDPTFCIFDEAVIGIRALIRILLTYRFTHNKKNIDSIINLISKLIEKGNAYVTDSDVFFDTASYLEYGKLSNRKIEELISGSRVEVDPEKKNKTDFVLWKRTKEGLNWDSPWGPGRPGWHIECSAMSMDALGETFDIHGGGLDLKFPHHENEIAQSECATNKEFARYWMHTGPLRIEDEKMSKSLGNYITIKDALRNFSSEALRFFLLSTHYRNPINFKESSVKEAQVSLNKLYTSLAGLDVDKEISLSTNKSKKEFMKVMDDDFNIPGSLAVLFNLSKEINVKKDNGDNIDYWWLYIILWAFVVGAIDTYFRKNKK